MATANLTEDFVRKFKVPEGMKDHVVFDEKLQGFGVRKYAKGHACYFLKYSVRGKSRKQKLGPVAEGNLKEMRKKAEAIKSRAADGFDAVAERNAEAEAAARLKTLGELIGP
jgi:hypothetical protein